MKQLTFDDLNKTEAYKNYNWLIGNPANLKIFFIEELQKDLCPELRADAFKRLEAL